MAADFFRQIPKAELHAHLHGSIRPATLVELVSAADHTPSAAALAVIRDVLPHPKRSLSECFRIFDVIHGAVRDVGTVKRITREMIHDCAADGVAYLEIRTTPRPVIPTSYNNVDSSNSDSDPSRLMDLYVQALTDTIAEVEHDCGHLLSIVVRVLLSVNRTGSLETAERIVSLAEKYSKQTAERPAAPPQPCSECLARLHGGSLSASSDSEQDIGRSAPDNAHSNGSRTESFVSAAYVTSSGSYGPYVVGVELSGDPTRGDAASFLPLLERARVSGLKVSVHCGEVMNVKETEAVLDWGPDRLGHMCVLSHTSTVRLLGLPQGSRIPIEVCPTSNALTLHLPSLHHHPTLNPWLDAGYPVAISTDDSGVFNVSLSDEYREVAQTYGLSLRRVAQLALAAFDFAFCDELTKAALKARAQGAVQALLAEV